LENTKEVVAKFERRMSTKVRKLEKLDLIKQQDFRKGELPEKYTAKILYG